MIDANTDAIDEDVEAAHWASGLCDPYLQLRYIVAATVDLQYYHASIALRFC
jgi:hypothetical protein